MTNKSNQHNWNLLQCKNLLRGTKPFTALSEIRNKLTTNNYSELIAWINQNPIVRAKVFHPYFTTSIATLKTIRPLAPTTDLREIEWAFEYIKPHLENLVNFVKLSKEYQKEVLSENYRNSRIILNDIESSYGQSLWLIKNRTAILQLSHGLEAHKEYVNSIRNVALKDGITDYVTYYVSMRNESAVSLGRFHETVAKNLSQQQGPEGLLPYLKYHISPSVELSSRDIACILRYEVAGTIIDIYEALIYSFATIAVNNYVNLIPKISSKVKGVHFKTQDSRLNFLSYKLNNQAFEKTAEDRLLNEAYGFLVFGNEERAIDVAEDTINEANCSFNTFELIARLSASGVAPKLPNNIYNKISSVVMKGDGVDENIADLIKLALNFNGCIWAYDVMRVINAELSSQVEIEEDPLTSLSAILNPSISPFKIRSIYDTADKSEYRQLYNDHMLDKVAEKYCNALVDLNVDQIQDSITKSCEARLIVAEIEFIKGNYDKALQLLANDLSFVGRYYKLRALKLTTNCQLKLGSLRECLDTIVIQIITDPNSHYVLPLGNCIDSISKEKYRNLKNDISLSIGYALYSKYINNKFDAYKGYAYEDFLISHGLRKPSQLREQEHLFDKKLLIYYLRHLCVESIMDTSIEFVGSKDIIDERLAVCKLIADISDQPDEALQTEIKEILRKQMVQKRMREIEQSKIYVDTEGIRSTLDKTLKESFSRYLTMFKYTSNSSDNTTRNKLKESIAEGDISGLLKLSLPKNEMNDLFESMIISIRDEFISNSEHGLDGYLSVRIRHGTLAGQLRSPLEAAHLITKRSHDTSEYIENYHWRDKARIFSWEGRAEFNRLLTQFSSGFDALVNEICSEWIQIAKDKAEKPLFDFSLNKIDIKYLSHKLNEETTYEHFIDFVFDYFYAKLDLVLEKARDKISVDVRGRINGLMDTLQNGVEVLSHDNDMGEFNNSLRMARTEMHLVIDRIIEWFRLSKTTATDPFTLEDAITISAESIKAYSKKFNVKIVIQENVPQIYSQGKLLSCTVDILFIIFENIVRHSGIISPRAEVNVSYENNMIVLEIKNQISEEVAEDINKERVEKIKATMEEGKYKQSVKKEGGTGFHKIRKILNHDFHTSTALSFGFIGNKEFYVKFSLPSMEVEE